MNKFKGRDTSVIVLFLLLFTFVSVVPVSVQADSSMDFIWEESKGVPAAKTWTVTFNKPIDKKSVNKGSVYVRDSQGGEVTITPSVSSSGDKIIISPPDGGYKPEASYTLYLTTDIKELGGTKLKRNVIKHFTIKKSTDPGQVTQKAYKSSFEITNDGKYNVNYSLSKKGDTITYSSDSTIVHNQLNTDYVYIPVGTSAVVSFDVNIKSPILSPGEELSIKPTDEPAYWRVSQSGKSVTEWQTTAPKYYELKIVGRDYYLGYSTKKGIVDYYNRIDSEDFRFGLEKETKAHLQTLADNEITIIAPYRISSYKEMPDLFVYDYEVKPNETISIQANSINTDVTVEANSQYDYVSYDRWNSAKISSTQPTSNVKRIGIEEGQEIVMTNKGTQSFVIYGRADTFKVSKQIETALSTKELLPKESLEFSNTSIYETSIQIDGSGEAEYASYTEDGSSSGYKHITTSTNLNGMTYLTAKGKTVVTNTGKSPLQLTYPTRHLQIESSIIPALHKVTLPSKSTMIWKSMHPAHNQITLSGSGNFDFVEYSHDGQLRDFDQVAITDKKPYTRNLGGYSAFVITNPGIEPLTLIAPSKLYSYEKADKEALTKMILDPTTSAFSKNSGNSHSSLKVISEDIYDFVEFYSQDRIGKFGRQPHLTSSIIKNEIFLNKDLLITNSGKKPLILYSPAYISIFEATSESALVEKTIKSSEKAMWTSNHNSSIEIILSGSGAYRYISRYEDGTVHSEGSRTLNSAWTNSVVIPWHGTLEITNDGKNTISTYGPSRFLQVK
ncbi:hypothetical protein CSV74_07515 [Sporosarcina sp. P19]|uniref:Ig-like domain-containing protein n=1 Tax=Sporosarcina sp. P19 TaxID=2048258 RepID=UPI000C16FD2B|nr:Ig-like domain-containing protein [Sporosarcina sp. P19]PIC77111.1 hypothetical protein CSV74_07515 [Sporosarcina sp. P19]